MLFGDIETLHQHNSWYVANGVTTGRPLHQTKQKAVDTPDLVQKQIVYVRGQLEKRTLSNLNVVGHRVLNGTLRLFAA